MFRPRQGHFIFTIQPNKLKKKNSCCKQDCKVLNRERRDNTPKYCFSNNQKEGEDVEVKYML